MRILFLVFICAALGAGLYKIYNRSLPQAVSAAESLEPMKLYALMENLEWLNVDRPLSKNDLLGKVLLLDFWTYCCINCIHILPDLKKLEREFGDRLVVIGVHSAKFEGEKSSKNILEAIDRYEIEHPVINDHQFVLWQSFGVKSWPSFVLIDAEGRYRGSTSGEGQYEGLKSAVEELISEGKEKSVLNSKPIPLSKGHSSSRTLSFPGKLVFDPQQKKFWVSDSNHHRLLRFSPEGTVDLVVGSGKSGLQDGDFGSAEFQNPQGLALDGDILYVADTGNHALRKINLKTKTVTSLAGDGRRGFERNPKGPIKKFELASPWDLAVLESAKDSKHLIIAMAGTHQLWSLDLKNLEVSVFAGSGREDLSDGAAESASLAQPSGLSVVGSRVYFADSETSSLRYVEKGVVKTLIGQGLFEFGKKDGAREAARLQHALGVYAQSDVILVSDTYNDDLRIFNLKTGLLSSLNIPNLNEPNAAIFVGDEIWLTDTNHHQIKRYDLKTKKVEVINLALPVKFESIEKLPFLPNLSELKFRGGLTETGRVDLPIELTLPSGFKVNETSPSYWELLLKDAEGHFHSLGKERISQNIFHATLQTLPAHSGLWLDVQIYFCPSSYGPGAQCELKSFRISLSPAVSTESLKLSVK